MLWVMVMRYVQAQDAATLFKMWVWLVCVEQTQVRWRNPVEDDTRRSRIRTHAVAAEVSKCAQAGCSLPDSLHSHAVALIHISQCVRWADLSRWHPREPAEEMFLRFYNLQNQGNCLQHLVSLRFDVVRPLCSPVHVCAEFLGRGRSKYFDRLSPRMVQQLVGVSLRGSGSVPEVTPDVVMYMLLPHAGLLLGNLLTPPLAVYPLMTGSKRKSGYALVEHMLPKNPVPLVSPSADEDRECPIISEDALQSVISDLQLWKRYIPELDQTAYEGHLAVLQHVNSTLHAPMQELVRNNWQYLMTRVLQGLLLGTKVPELHMKRVLRHSLEFILPPAWASFFIEQCLESAEQVLPSPSTLRRYKLTLNVAWLLTKRRETLRSMG